jgi:hypothetical protein
MKVLLDVCTPVQVRLAFANHEVHTAVKMGCGRFPTIGVYSRSFAVSDSWLATFREY